MKTILFEVSILKDPIDFSITIVIFLIFVYITRWIFGINKIITNQEVTNDILKK